MPDGESFKAKRDIALRVMMSKGAGRWGSGPPPIYRWLWFCGLQVRPPQFSSFQSNFVHGAALWCTVFGLATAFLWPHRGHVLEVTLLQAEIFALALGVLASLGAAFEYRYYARKYKLPAWSDLRDEAEVFE